jgi:hypothetical protein
MRTIHRYAAVGLLLLTVIFSVPTLSQAQAPHTTAGARVVWHLVGRIFLNPETFTGVVVAYATDIDGVPGPLFNGAPSETTAYFTLKTDVISLQPLPNNGDIALAIANPGDARLYFTPNPNHTWTDPNSFATGQLIATFHRAQDVVMFLGPFSSDTFSYNLVSSQNFTINGQTLNFNTLAPHGITNTLIASQTPQNGSSDFPVAFPAFGTGVAIGHKVTGLGEGVQ